MLDQYPVPGSLWENTYVLYTLRFYLLFIFLWGNHVIAGI